VCVCVCVCVCVRQREREREAGRGWLMRNKVCSDVFARAHTHTH
jgi:hypothetical protein